MDGLHAEQPAADARSIGRRDIAAALGQTRTDGLRDRQIQSEEEDVVLIIEDLEASVRVKWSCSAARASQP